MPGTYFSARLASAISGTIAAELGVQATIGELSCFPPRALVDATEAVIHKMPDLVDSWGPVAMTPTPFSPVVDGVVLPDAPWRALTGGATQGIDLLVGHTRDEYSLFNARRDSDMTDGDVTATLARLAPALDGNS
jgi:para-nitrobenzyl esterase